MTDTSSKERKQNEITDASPKDAEAKNEINEDTDKKESEMTDKKNKKEQGQVEESAEEETLKDDLADGVTLDPQNDEQLDLNLMEDPVAVSKISVPTDDDQGEFLEDADAITEIRKFIDDNKAKKEEELTEELLNKGTEIASNFNKKLSFKEALTLAVITKYYLLYGMALIILKDAVKETGQNWIFYYKKHFIPSTYSSAIKYMKLARVPDIIRYAFLGLERLEKIFTAIKDDYDMKGPDPIGTFFRDSSISIDFHECELEKFRHDIDAAVAKIRINNLFKEENKDLPKDKVVKNTVDPSLVDAFIREGKKIEAGLMTDLYLYAKDGANPNTILKEHLKGGNGRILKSINKNLTGTKTIEGFPKLISELKSKVTYLSNHTALVQKITPQHMKDLQAQVTALKALVKAQKTKK